MKLLILLLFISCSVFTVAKDYSGVNPRLKVYVERFNNYHYHFLRQEIDKTLKVELGIIEGYPNAAGVYNRILDRTLIAESKFNKWNESAREMVLFHELGHHILRLSHDWSERRIAPGGCPRSIMISDYDFDEKVDCYKKHRKYYIKELFYRSPGGW